MEFTQVLLLSLVEGLTEFLPVSSTGHLIALSHFLDVPQTSNHIAFSIIIQLAAILALFVSYKNKFTLGHIKLWLRVFFSFLFLAIIGFIFRHEIKTLFSIEVVGVMFIIGGLVFLWVEWFYKKKSPIVYHLKDVNYKQALIIGIGQVFSLIPGTSRAGSSIVFGMISGLDRKTSTEYSFLLALPVMLTVSGYEFISNFNSFNLQDLELLLAGFVISFLCALASLKLFIAYLKRFSFIPFAIYRIIFGILLLFIALS